MKIELVSTDTHNWVELGGRELLGFFTSFSESAIALLGQFEGIFGRILLDAHEMKAGGEKITYVARLRLTLDKGSIFLIDDFQIQHNGQWNLLVKNRKVLRSDLWGVVPEYPKLGVQR